MIDLKSFQKEWLPKINQQLENDLSMASPDPDLVAMMKYAVLNGGKRLRPLLTLAVVTSFGESITPSILKVATAIEWVHSYSLVHDDLPVMDNDMFRRGKPSVHALYGEANAILVGDALLTGAFGIIATANSSCSVEDCLPTEELLLITQNLAREAGGSGMVLGQIHDMDNHTEEQNASTNWLLNDVYSMKTAALIRYTTTLGAILTHQNVNVEDNHFDPKKAMYDFGEKFGLAFQIQDDLDDYQQDQLEDVNSLPHIVGVKEAQSVLDQYLFSTQEILANTVEQDQQFDRRLLDDFVSLIGDKK
ncbi:polyprenyl synthetase family protein [Leuconostoc mesenteroides]|uniref:polyprenyl synthetase family protein n=1 Tax=Leuconostoc mesenteroides TaxID=1245 RepID=UPI00236097EB|nr:polyprenyl synthetase family protein [Leuconostoc mesenteroides]